MCALWSVRGGACVACACMHIWLWGVRCLVRAGGGRMFGDLQYPARIQQPWAWHFLFQLFDTLFTHVLRSSASDFCGEPSKQLCYSHRTHHGELHVIPLLFPCVYVFQAGALENARHGLRFEDVEVESDYGVIFSVSGPGMFVPFMHWFLLISL